MTRHGQVRIRTSRFVQGAFEGKFAQAGFEGKLKVGVQGGLESKLEVCAVHLRSQDRNLYKAPSNSKAISEFSQSNFEVLQWVFERKVVLVSYESKFGDFARRLRK